MQRRSLILKAVTTLAAVTICFSAQANELVIASAGGATGDANIRVFFPAYEEATGWTARHVPAEANRMLEIEAMVRAGRAIWDVSEISGSDYPLAVERGLLEPIDYALIDPDGALPEAARKEFAVGTSTYSTALVQRTDKTPPGTTMSTWADFWNVEAFPGPRSLRSRPEYNLEFALLADGVEAGDLYEVLSTEEGVDRAFAKLDEIKDHIPVWWTSGAQLVQLLSDGEVFFASAWNGRVKSLQESGVPVSVVWNGAALHIAHVGIVKGSANIEQAHKYISMRATNAELGKQYVELMPYPSFAKGLIDLVPAELAQELPVYPDNLSVQFEPDESFWAQNMDQLTERWNEWMLE